MSVYLIADNTDFETRESNASTQGGEFTGRDIVINEDEVIGTKHLYEQSPITVSIPASTSKLLQNIQRQEGLKPEDVLAKGAVLMAVGLKAEKAGFHLAIVNNDGEIIANLGGVEGHPHPQVQTTKNPPLVHEQNNRDRTKLFINH